MYSGSRVDLVTLQKFPNPAWGSGFINILDEIPNYRQGLMYIHMYVLVLFYMYIHMYVLVLFYMYIHMYVLVLFYMYIPYSRLIW